MNDLAEDIIRIKEQVRTTLDAAEEALSVIGSGEIKIVLTNVYDKDTNELEIVAVGRRTYRKYWLFGRSMTDTVFYRRRDFTHNNGSYAKSVLVPTSYQDLTAYLDKNGKWCRFLKHNPKLVENIRQACTESGIRPAGSPIRIVKVQFDGSVNSHNETHFLFIP